MSVAGKWQFRKWQIKSLYLRPYLLLTSVIWASSVLTSVHVRLWHFKLTSLAKVFGQNSHLKGLSPACLLTWALTLPGWVEILAHIRHTKWLALTFAYIWDFSLVVGTLPSSVKVEVLSPSQSTILRCNFFTTHGVHLQWRAPSASKNCLAALHANQFFVFVAGKKIFAGDQTCQSFSVHVSIGHVWYMSVISWQTNQRLFLLYQDAVVEFDTLDFCSLLVIIETVWQNIAVHFGQPLPVFVHRPSVTFLHRFLKNRQVWPLTRFLRIKSEKIVSLTSSRPFFWETEDSYHWTQLRVQSSFRKQTPSRIARLFSTQKYWWKIQSEETMR